MAQRLRTDSPISREIVIAFLDFLQSVELSEDVDREGLDVARECLEQAFKLNQTSTDDQLSHGLMAELFRKKCSLVEQPGPIPTRSAAKDDQAETSKGKGHPVEAKLSGQDEVFGQFYAALDKMNFFASTPSGDEDHAQLEKATEFFEEAMRKLGGEKISRDALASSFKTLGNQAMQSKSYPKAVDLYTCAIALEADNAVFYCNRAAAYTQLHKYDEAIADCTKSIELKPSYSKGYSRLGLAYYEKGMYSEALSAFQKALQLDPDNPTVQSNVQMTQQRWSEQIRGAQAGQSTGPGGVPHGTSQRGIPVNIDLGTFELWGGPRVVDPSGVNQSGSSFTVTRRFDLSGEDPNPTNRSR